MVTATFRFYEELNDFLARPLRRREFSCAYARGASAKHMIEMLERLDLAHGAQPFPLCLMCNAPLRRIAKDEVGSRAPDGVLQRHGQFVTCDVCQRVFWERTQWQRMRARMDSVAAPARRASRDHPNACGLTRPAYNTGLFIWQRPSVWR